MAFDLELLAEKLLRYRKQFETSIEEMSSATGITEDDLNAFERAEKHPTGDQILIIADYYKCDYKFFISNEKLAPFEETETLFRMYGEELSREDRWAIQEFLYLSECEAYLEEMLDAPGKRKFSFNKRGSFLKRHGKEAAASLREFFNYSSKEIRLNIYDEFRNLGIHVFRRLLGNTSISGLFVDHPIAGKCILINYDEDIYRQRFSAAHEAGHAILDTDKDVIISFDTKTEQEVIRRTGWDEKRLIEIRANTFASHFLMPPEFLVQLPNPKNWDQDDIIKWANNMKVSTEALAYALKESELISDKQVQFFKSVKVPNDEKNDPELPSSLSTTARNYKEHFLQRGLSNYYVRLCFNAYTRRIISSARLAEMLLVDENELAKISKMYNEDLSYAG